MGEWILDTLVALGAWGGSLQALLVNVFPPIPSELVMTMAGYLVARDEMTLTIVIVVGTACSLPGALRMYATAGLAAWTTLLVYAGYALGRNLVKVDH